MPIYEYSCEACGDRFEKLVRHRVERGTEHPACPSCGGKHVQQEYSTFAARAGAAYEAAPEPSCGADMCGQGMCGSGMCGVN